MFVRITTLFAAAALTITPAIAIAQPAGYETPSVQVNVNDLNLSTASGQSVLRARIASAVRNVCNDTSGGMTLQESQAVRRCSTQARNAALLAVRTLVSSRLAAK